MKDLRPILKRLPKGTKLYSPLYGDVYLNETDKISYNEEDLISVYSGNKLKYFLADGRLPDYENGECMLFPSKDRRTWDGWESVLPTLLKFNVGDWIVNNNDEFFFDGNSSAQIESIENHSDGIKYWFANKRYIFASYAHEYCHKWSLSDAKRGDVLSDGETIFIYGGSSYEGNPNAVYAYFKDEDRVTRCDGDGEWTSDAVRPATEEERKLFAERMCNAGYYWSKELSDVIKTVPFTTQPTILDGSDSKFPIGDFKPFDRVLVRDCEEDYWGIAFFERVDERWDHKFICLGTGWRQCVPYNDETKDLLYTDKASPDKYVNW